MIGRDCANSFSIDLCYRRQWPAPVFTPFRSRSGWLCMARVNNREYQSDTGHETERLAVENAAMRAYAICQNFSKSDGMYPPERKKKGGAKVQGRPIAIGTERHSYYTDDSRSTGSSSGGSSPTSYGSFSSYESSRRPIGSSGSSSSSSSNRYSSHRSSEGTRFSTSHRSSRR